MKKIISIVSGLFSLLIVVSFVLGYKANQLSYVEHDVYLDN